LFFSLQHISWFRSVFWSYIAGSLSPCQAVIIMNNACHWISLLLFCFSLFCGSLWIEPGDPLFFSKNLIKWREPCCTNCIVILESCCVKVVKSTILGGTSEFLLQIWSDEGIIVLFF
jgi:hypothetical protein